MLPVFQLEDYLEPREFSSKYMFCASDVQDHTMGELLAMADAECQGLWNTLGLHYTEARGLPVLREEILSMYRTEEVPLDGEQVVVFAGAEEGIYCACHALLTTADHALVITPCYQSLKAIPESLCEVTPIALSAETGWRLDLEAVKAAIRPNTKLILINFPHNPTGALITHQQQTELIALARAHGIYLFSDEVYRLLEYDTADRLMPMASRYEKGLSLGVMSKAFGLAGLRIGWIACQDRALMKRMLEMKYYLSICNSAPSEVLALIALRNANPVLARNNVLIQANLAEVDAFFDRNQALISWVRPKGGCIGFPYLKPSVGQAFEQDIEAFGTQLLAETGVLILPGAVYETPGMCFRMGFGRNNTLEALGHFETFLQRVAVQ